MCQETSIVNWRQQNKFHYFKVVQFYIARLLEKVIIITVVQFWAPWHGCLASRICLLFSLVFILFFYLLQIWSSFFFNKIAWSSLSCNWGSTRLKKANNCLLSLWLFNYIFTCLSKNTNRLLEDSDRDCSLYAILTQLVMNDQDFFFLEHAEELRIFVLRRRNSSITGNQNHLGQEWDW